MDYSHIIIELETGNVKIKLRPDLAPNHVKRIVELSEEGFYDGVVFHRVIPDFMAQTGDPTGTGTGSSDKPNLKQEFSNEKHTRGVASMARSSDPNSANSQFFICYNDASWLDGQYTIWGEVVEGMEFVDSLKKGTDQSGIVENPDKMISVRPVKE
ncbi:MAG: peptidylprolyl isomerase [Thermodesulfobacteriota bacterium]|nr:peptidylprolyl isomerase [bacterium]MDA9754020.1 peptidylprolyl isomerase [bacterium]MEC7925255.1 peptidylprolyl isomerase [Thermodesulfobacteriota bacterium]|tara:strand:- start:5093 stop:5560 length:468 start_codon:yes stop_codon:yes gene_type:complete